MMRAEALKIDREALLAAALRGAFPDERGRYGPFGGRYVPETLVPALDRLEEGVRAHLRESGFRAELESELRTWVGRPTPLTLAQWGWCAVMASTVLWHGELRKLVRGALRQRA